MKFQKMIRMQLLMAGFGAMLLLPGLGRAQQDVDPTIYDVNPAALERNTAAPVQAAQNGAPVVVAAEQPAAAPEMIEAERVTSADNLLVFGLALGSGLIAFCGIALARRPRALPSAL